MKKYSIITAFILIFLFNSCLDHGYDLQVHQTDEVGLAKNWFVINFTDSPKRLNNSRLGSNEPSWDRAKYYITKDIEIFEIPLTTSRDIVSLGDGHLISSYYKLIIFKRKNIYQAFIAEFIPSNNLATNEQNGREVQKLFDNYTGVINFYDIKTDNILSGYLFRQGKSISKLRNKQKSNAQGRTDCYSITTTYWTCSNSGCDKDYETYYEYCTYTPDQSTLDQSLEPADTNGGGSSGGTSSNDLIELDQTIGRLCDNLNFQQVGNSFTTEVSGLGITAINHLLNTVIHAELGTCCIQIPDYHLRDKSEASSAFANAFNASRQEISILLNAGVLAPNATDIRNKLKLLLIQNLNETNPGSTFSSGPCFGNIPKNVADYGC